IEELRATLDIGYFRPGEIIIDRGQRSEDLHVIIKGSVEERDDDLVEALLGPNESFDARSLVHGAAGARFVAAEETLCYLAPKAKILDLIGRNAGFAAFFYSEISRKLISFARRQEAEGFESVLRARVGDVRYHAAAFIDGSASIEQAGHLMREQDNNALFVREDGRIGIVTGMNLSKAAVLDRRRLDTPRWCGACAAAPPCGGFFSLRRGRRRRRRLPLRRPDPDAPPQQAAPRDQGRRRLRWRTRGHRHSGACRRQFAADPRPDRACT